jgi:hypothetical protein
MRTGTTAEELAATLGEVDHRRLEELLHDWEVWARDDQLPPPGDDWRTWLILGGRGAGKTRAGAEWVRAQALGKAPFAARPADRIALVAETHHDARAVMVEGVSGILAVHPPGERTAGGLPGRRPGGRLRRGAVGGRGPCPPDERELRARRRWRSRSVSTSTAPD